MPTNPFQGIGSRGGASEIASQTRAVKAYDQARKRLLSTMASEEKAAAGVAAAHTAAMQKRSRDHAAYESELKNTSNLLKSQGEVLKNLDVQRSRYHNEEMKRSDSLLKRYEGIKTALREIQEDGGNTSTVLGSIFQPFSAGIANMQKFGELPKVTRAIKDVNLSLRDVSGSASRAGSAVEATGAAMLEVSGSVWKYRTAVDELNVGLAELKVKYNDATDGTKKLADQFVNLSRMDLVKEGAVDTVVEVTDAIKRLEAQGVNAEEALNTLAERSLTSGRSFLETAEDLREVTATADILTERINNSESALRGFAFTTRDDLVRAIADATRNLDSQVVSLDNVAASYAYAQEQAARYGLSVKGSQKVAQAFTNALFKERKDAPAMIAGLEMQRNLSKALRDAEKAMSEEEGREIEYGKASEEQQRILRRQAYSAIGIEQTDENDLAMRQGIETLGDSGLGAVNMRNLFAGTKTAIKADLDARMEGLDLGSIELDSVLAELLAGIDGLEGLSTSQRLVYTDMLREGKSGEVAEAIQKLQEEAADRSADEENLQSSALTAVLTFKDPIQQLFNIKDYIKAIALNVSNIVKMIGGVVGVDLNSLLPDLTRDIVAEERSPEALSAMREASDSERQEMIRGVIDAQKALSEAGTEAQRSEAQKRLDNAQKELKRVEDSRLELELSEYRRSEILGRRYSPPTSNQESEEEERSLPFFSAERSAERERGVLSAISTASAAFLGPQISENIEGAARQYIDSAYRQQIQTERERSAAPGLRDMSSSSRAPSSRSPAQTTQPGEVDAVGEGSVSVNTSGETIANVQIKFKNMGEAVAYHNSDTARLLNQHGLA